MDPTTPAPSGSTGRPVSDHVMASRLQVGNTVGSEVDSVAAARRGWDDMADEYQAEHGAFLGDAGFIWCPEGWDEADLHLLGDPAGRRVLEVGGGAAQCGRWLVTHGAQVISLDLSGRMLDHAARLTESTGIGPGLIQAHAGALPFVDRAFDAAFTAFGAVPFVADLGAVHREVARVLKPGGRWVFATTHPVRWGFPDDPGVAGLTAVRSYFDRQPYVEFDKVGEPNYVEHHNTIGDHVRELVRAGFVIDALLEPGWPEGLTQEWGQWSPLRGQYLPGTLIVQSHLGG